MKLDTYSSSTNLFASSEIKRVKLLMFFRVKTEQTEDFKASVVAEWFTDAGLPKPNTTRLRRNLISSNEFIAGKKEGYFRLFGGTKELLETEYGNLFGESEEINSNDSILPESLFSDSPKTLLSLCKQLNASFEKNIFDGCAILMRKLLEILMILMFRKFQLENIILNEHGNYFGFKAIANKAFSHKEFYLTPKAKDMIDYFREIGNLSAHNLYFNCRKADIARNIVKFRATTEELINKAI